MAITNPGQKTYEDYATEELTLYVKNNLCEQILPTWANFVPNQCKTIVDTARPQIKEFIAYKTKRRNFLFFSIYQTDLYLSDALPAYRVETVGILLNFYVYQAEQL